MFNRVLFMFFFVINKREKSSLVLLFSISFMCKLRYKLLYDITNVKLPGIWDVYIYLGKKREIASILWWTLLN